MMCSNCKHKETCPDVGRPCDHWRPEDEDNEPRLQTEQLPKMVLVSNV